MRYVVGISAIFCFLFGSASLGLESGPVRVTGRKTGLLEQRFDAAIGQGDYDKAKAIDMQLSRMCNHRLTPIDTGQITEGGCLVADGPRLGITDPDFVGDDVAIDTGPVMSFGATTDSLGNIWVAAAGIDTKVRVYRSCDLGRTWEQVLWFSHGVDVPKIELVYGGGDSSFVYVFYLNSLNAGDLWAMRINPDGSGQQAFPVAVGSDTINDFSVAADHDRHHYLYCLYANEMRTGRTGGFTRSLDFGKSWEVPQDWWNCWDPCVIYSTGSSVHCAWRYAATGREIHFETNRFYGRPRRWWPYCLISGTTQKCWDPVIAAADTGTEWNSMVWVFYTVARRDTSRLDLEYAYGTDCWGWTRNRTLGDPFRDEWFPELQPYYGSPSGYVHLCYNTGGKGAKDKTVVYYRCANALAPENWSPRLKMNDPRANALFEGARPKVICPANSPHQFPGVLFSYYNPGYASGLYFDAPWGRGTQKEVKGSKGRHRNPFLLDAPVSGNYTCWIYDATGRRVRRLFSGRLETGFHSFEWDGRSDGGEPVRSGTYFVRLSGPAGLTCARVVITR
ncbi:hypothetical protein CH330_04915 [candidate division WOR-3 bacterium JGI_Cruoil_03_51_56]|uniref:FlgD/Vpr Ig-like domain-containing protein n=1 Tax=candidate division WOR-3 bacterium JGI_Cruoil_03_51_56 TaxID=1973747 RepID=A0A235BTZ1_UNCW3|nr:MAG: hypothetical protein CH330_04915 [candidate division WOR-3 bacterium JGI_Cruoil_03_51_56]